MNKVSLGSSYRSADRLREQNRNQMEKVILFIHVASGLGVNSTPPHHKYFYVGELKSWTEARSYCRQNYTDLATIENMEDVRTLNDMAASLGTTSLVWIGLYDDVNSWRWSMSDPNFYQHEEKQFRNWTAGEPNNYGGQEGCVKMFIDGSWNDAPCSQTLKTVCFNVSGTTPQFYYIDSKMNWTQAQSYCRQLYTDLASVRHVSDNQAIKNLITEQAWIGLYRDSWKWVDGRNSSYRYWNTGEPNNNGKEECAVANLGNTGKWLDWNCGEKKPFICYAAPQSKQVIKLKMVFSSSLARDNLAVLEDLLEKLKQKLKDNGVKGNIKLSWRKQSDGKVFLKEKKKDEL